MSKCPICHEETKRPIVAAIHHFRPFEWHDPRFILGNMRTFGFWSGIRANLTLYFPFLNTILNWKYRTARLEELQR